jgi:DNA-binding transcriptional ArsR family regulator
MRYPLTALPDNPKMENVKKAVLPFRAINHPLRQQILQEINQKSRCTVTYIQDKLGLDQSVASQHLGILRRQGLVVSRRQGQCILYQLNIQKLLHLTKITEQLLQSQER